MSAQLPGQRDPSFPGCKARPSRSTKSLSTLSLSVFVDLFFYYYILLLFLLLLSSSSSLSSATLATSTSKELITTAPSIVGASNSGSTLATTPTTPLVLLPPSGGAETKSNGSQHAHHAHHQHHNQHHPSHPHHHTHHPHHSPHYPTLPNGTTVQHQGQVLDLSQHPFLPPDLQPLTPPPSVAVVAPPHHPSDQTDDGSRNGADQPELPLLPPSGGGIAISEAEMAGTNPKGLKFEEEPTDSYIVRSKSALLRCKTLNALNAWFKCNSGDELRIQSNQKVSNYVDPQTGIRMIEIDLEVSRNDVEEHHNSGYTNPFQCWCTAYGGQHQIMSRKASVSFSYLKKHFHREPESIRVKLGTHQLSLSCQPPDGHPKPTVFWMKNDVIIVESDQSSMTSYHQPRSASGSIATTTINYKNLTTIPSKLSPNHRKIFVAKKLSKQNGKFSVGKSLPTKKDSRLLRKRESLNSNSISKTKVPKGVENDDDDEDDEDEDFEFEGIRLDDDDEEEDEDDDEEESSQKDLELLPETFDDLLFLNNYQMGGDNSLLIKLVSLTDQANYTCGVRNPAGVRFSDSALVTVYVNGEWSSWSSWSSCHLPTGAKCGHGTQKRTRHCSNPAPVNSGQLCLGDSSQVSECNILCSPVDGFWSPWSVWSTCSHQCSQFRRRVCNNPAPEFGGNDCFGPDNLIRNCSGGLCRKGLGPNDPIGFDLNLPDHSSASGSSASNERLYFLIILVLTLIIVVFILYIAFKFNRRQRRYGKKSSAGSGAVLAGLHHGGGVGGGGGAWNDLELERSAAVFGTAPVRMGSSSDPDDGQATMLLLLQQQQQQQQQQQNQLLNSLPLSSPLAPPHSHLHRNNLRLLQQQQQQQQQQSVQSTNNGCGILIPEKYQLISRLNNGSTAGGASVVDHFVVRYDAAPVSSSPGPYQGLPMAHHSGTLSSVSTNSTTNNKYEEPIFNVRSPHHLQSNQQQQQQQQLSHGPSLPQPLPPLHAIQYHAQQQQQPHHPPPPLPQPNQPQLAQLSQPQQQHSTGTNHSSDTTVTTATVTTTSSSELSGSEPSHVDPESEPDYAEPIVELTTNSIANYRRGGSGAGSALASPHYRYQGLSQINKSPHHHPRPRATGASTENSSSEISSEITAKLCGKHEKFIKLTADLVKQGHYSAMPNLGVALYLTPNLLAPNSRHLSTSPGNDLYLRYGIDTSTRLSGLCPLSPVVTVNFSRSSMVEPLLRPFVLVFRHCVHLRNSKLDHNLTVLWQECDIASNSSQNKSDHTMHGTPSVGSSSSDKWIEILRYGQENLNTACYLYCDSSHCYLVTNFVGKYLLCLKNNHSVGHKMALPAAAAVHNNNNDSDYYSNCQAYETNSNDSFSNDSSALLTATNGNTRELQLGPQQQLLLRELDFVKLINFSVLIESPPPPPQRSGGFHRIKVFIYDHLPSSVLQLSSRLGPGSTRAQRTIVRLGEQNCTTLRLSAKAGGSVYFELKLPGNSLNHHHSNHRQTRGAPVKRVEVPVEDLWNCGPNWMLNCLFVVGPNGTGPECTGVVNSDLIQFDENSEVDPFEEDLQEEDFEDLDDFVYDEDQIDPLLMDIDDQQSMAADDEDTVDLDLEPNFEVKIWQSKSSLPQLTDSSHKMSYLSNIVILNRQSLRRLKRKPLASLIQNRNRFKTTSGSGHKYRYREEWLQLFHQTAAGGGKDLQIRTLLMHHLDQPRADQLDWRQFAAASKLDHYLPYFASQPSPTGQIFELWEARVLNEFLLAKVAIPNVDQRRSGSSGSSGTEYGAIGSSNPTSNSKALKEFYYSKLVHLLQTIKRNDLIEIILQHQC